jgi:rhodanese-related sulfurtransferase
MKKSLLFIFLLGTIFSCKSPAEEKSELKETIQVLDKAAFKSGIANTDIQLIDVRTPKEYEEGHIGDATLIDFLADGFEEKIQNLDKNKPVYLYCRSGGRSGKASKLMAELGFVEINDLEGGYNNWIE